MDEKGQDSAPITHHAGPGRPTSTVRALHGRGGRRALAPLVGLAFAAALLTGCGGTGTEDPTEEPSAETSEQSTEADDETSTTSEASTTSGTGEEDSDDEDSDDEATDDAESPTDDDQADDQAGGENLFEGSWSFGHDTKELSAEELAALLEEEAEARGPEEMSLGVECGDGVDTVAGDSEAECIAYADEGVEHLWLITVGPADAGLEIEVENAG